MRYFLSAIFAVLLAFPVNAYAAKLKVVASFSILGDMTHAIAGDEIELKTLVGSNGDAHVYEPTPADAKAVAAADLVIINGLGFEGWLPRLVESSGYKNPVVVATIGITPLAFSGDNLTQDPHAWQSLANGKIYVANIRDTLVKADPAHATYYKANATKYLEQIDDLNSQVKKEIATIPADKRKVITSHDAFQYFARAYGVEFIAPMGISTESEPSAGDLARLIDQMRQQKIRTLFMENISDPRLIHQLQADGGAIIGGTLYSDALSAPDGPAPTYLEMFRNNVAALVKGMGQAVAIKP